VTADLAAYERLLFETLLRVPNVSNVRSNFAFDDQEGGPLLLDIFCKCLTPAAAGGKHRVSYGGRGSPPLATADSLTPREGDRRAQDHS
jgi:hypothetical protein